MRFFNMVTQPRLFFFFFFNDTATPEIYPLSLHGALPISIAVNVSAVEFRDKGFVYGVQAILRETGLEARYLELELTESVLMEDAEATVSVLQELKMMGEIGRVHV